MTGGFDVAAYVPRLLLARPEDAPRHWTEEGSLLFLDISGFTRLSDQLMRRGREGAEDLVSSLVRIFTLLLSASDDGGDVLKFGGDALLIFYTGPDHARRAVHAAYQAQRLLGVVGRVELPGARTHLSMSCGVDTGRFDFLLPGRLQPSLVVTGASTTRVLGLERRAESGQILAGAAMVELLPASWRGAVADDGAALVRRVGTVPSSGSQILFHHPDESVVWPHLPVVFRNRPDLLRSSSDHRRAAMAFVHVTGMDELVARDPAEALARADRLAAVVEAATVEAGVCIVDTDVGDDGYKYFLAAGAPQAVEDPEGHMLRALLTITGAQVGLQVRAGMASGQVFAGSVGAPFRSTYTAMGDTTNTAARLCGKAPPGTVLALGSALDRSLTEFALADERAIELRGKPEPLRVARVVRMIGPRGRQARDVPFVGRAAELGVLGDALARAAGGAGSVVEVLGEEGLGKSRLVQEAVARSGLPAVVVTADPYTTGVAHHTLRLLLRPLLGLATDADSTTAGRRLTGVVRERCPALAPWLPLVAPAVGADVPLTTDVAELDESFRRARFHDSVRQLLEALLPDPVAVVVEDAHWVDETSAEALAHAFAGARERPWAVLLTTRPDAPGGLRARPDDGTVLTLEPLPAADAQSLVAAGGGSLRPDDAGAIVGRGAGNPYFLLALADQQEGDGLPGTVEELVGSRVDRLESGERELLRRAAVLGSRFPARLYASATGDAEFARTVRSPGLARFLDVDEHATVSFRRELYREVAYGQLSFRARRQLHLEVAQAIRRDPALAGDARLPMLSLHYEAAHQWDEAFVAATRAAAAARAAWAHQEAVQFCRRALRVGRRAEATGEQLRSLREELGVSCNVVGRFQDARDAFRDAMRGEEDHVRQVRLLIRAGRADTELGRYGGALRAYRRARDHVALAPEADRPGLQAEVDVEEAGTRFLQGRLRACCGLCERALAIVDEAPPGPANTRLRARAMYMYDAAAGDLDGAEAVRFGEQPLRMFEELGDLYHQSRVSNNLGVQYLQEGRWDRAVEVLTEGRTVARRAGDLLTSAIMGINLGELLCYQGRAGDAERELREAAAVAAALDVPRITALAQAYLGLVLLRKGDHDGSGELLDEAGRVLAEIGSRYGVDEVEVRKAELALARGDHADLEARLAGLLQRRSSPPAPLHTCLAERLAGQAAAAAGTTESAREHLRRSVALAEEIGADYERAVSLRLLAGLGGPGARDAGVEAANVLARLGVTPVPHPRVPPRTLGESPVPAT